MAEPGTADSERQTPMSRALGTIRSLRQQLQERGDNQPIAVIGVGLRLPGGIEDLDGYWDVVANGRDLVRNMGSDRMGPFREQWEGLPQRGGFLDEVLGFDAQFFGVSPREARALDPQQRLLLEVSWEAMENAAIPADLLAGSSTGLYLGITGDDYREWMTGDPDAYWATGNGSCFAAGRIAYTLGLTGPSIAVDTACSSSLVAVHLAMRALRLGECDIAMAAGVNLILSPKTTRLLRHTRSLAPDGLCKAFDARANGFTRGEGCAAVVLKRLDHARRDGDRIHAVLRGSAVNQDGRSTGFTAPNVLAQVAVIRAALSDAGLGPSDIGYVEAHGTGTALGDPIEMEALATALGRANGGAPMMVGSVKTNLGHLEAAAGIAGLAKSILCLRERAGGPVVHFRTLNPRIDLSGTGITVPDGLTSWPTEAGRCAGVSSFGMSGTNAHVIVAAPNPGDLPDQRVPAAPVGGFEISAKSPQALRALAGRYADRLAALAPSDYQAFADTASFGRTRHDVAVRVSATDARTAIEALTTIATGGDLTGTAGTTKDDDDCGGRQDHLVEFVAGESGGPRLVIDLPHYPWERQRYAPAELPADPDAAPGVAPTADAFTESPVGYDLTWEHAQVQPDADPELILAGDDEELLTLAVGEATATGRRGTVLAPQPLPTGPTGWEYQPLPATRAQWESFWAARQTAGPVRLVLTLTGRSFPADSGEESDPAAEGAALCIAVTTALDAAAKSAAGQHCRVSVVTRATRLVVADDQVRAGQHGLLQGMAPVLGLEFGVAWGALIDVPAVIGPADVRALLSFVSARDAARTAAGQEQIEDLAAIRDGSVFVARLRPVGQSGAPLSVREHGTYLVTGALGAVGRAMVADLVRRGARHLLLIGRRSTQDLDTTSTQWLTGLRLSGVQVVYRGGGCHTAAAVSAACEALAELPPVRGVLHAAGAIAQRPAADDNVDAFADVLRAKAAGAWWLHLASRRWPLDFFVLVSSVSALWGTAGYAAYAAANGALDSLAAHRASQGMPAVSIAYGPWDLEGMADTAARDRFARMGVLAMDAASGCSALRAQAPGNSGYLVACPLDADRFGRVMARLRRRGLLAELEHAGDPGGVLADDPVNADTGREFSILQQLSVLPVNARRVAAREHVTGIIAAELGHDHADAIRQTVGFFDLGLDSIMAVDVANRLSDAFTVGVHVTEIFDNPTVVQLSDHLLDRAFQSAEPVGATSTRWVERATAPAPQIALVDPTPEEKHTPEPIAIVGMAGRFPGADSVDGLWDLLNTGRDGVGAVPADRWAAAALIATDAGEVGRITTDQGGFLSQVDQFDAAFFDIPAREAESLDPQHRLLLECAWHALEDSGISPDAVRNSRTGVFVGISNSDYARLLGGAGPEHVDAYYGTGVALNAAAGRISYVLGLNGPAIAVDTACSSSLVAVHLGVRSLRSAETDAVLVGGVNVIVDPLPSVAVSRAHMLSADGRCRAFSANANGFVRGEGVGVLVLKRLSDAKRDGDRVLAVIRGSAVNQDGASSGLTAPSGRAQEAVIRAALADASIDGSAVEFLEAHGTGTSLGDPIEITSAWKALGPGRPSSSPLFIGSVKSNIGHCESASGMAAVIKTVLALRHNMIPANLHFDVPNPHVPWAEMNVRVVNEPAPWQPNGTSRVAGVSGFGFSGTNAHLILADPPRDTPAPSTKVGDPHLIPLSAPDAAGLERLTDSWQHRLTEASAADLPELARVAGVGRRHYPHRRALLGATTEQLLRGTVERRPSEPATHAPRVAFLFSGQGSQYFGMGRGLYETEPVFRDTFDRCDTVLAPLIGRSMADLMLYGDDHQAINRTGVTQPALVTLQIALVALWESWGVRPTVVMGHSAGAISAAVTAGVLNLRDGLTLIAERARLMQSTATGAMMSITAGVADVVKWIGTRDLDVAAINAPTMTVVSGTSDAIEEFAAWLGGRRVRCQRLAVSHAFHSRLLDPVLDEFLAALAALTFSAPTTPFISDLTGLPVSGAECDASYWVRHARRPVLFHAGAQSFAAEGVDLCLEIGPDRTLLNLLRAADLLPRGGGQPSLRRGSSEPVAVREAAAGLYRCGQDLAWDKISNGRADCRVDVPRYPFAPTRHWTSVRSGPVTTTAPGTGVSGPVWGTELTSPALRGKVFATQRSSHYPAHVVDHRLYGTISVPGASHLATVLSALAASGQPTALEDVYFPRALVITEGEVYDLQVIQGEPEQGRSALSVQSLVDRDRGQWQEHLSARTMQSVKDNPRNGSVARTDPHKFIASADRHLSGVEFYRHFRGVGYHLGPSFRWISDIWIRDTEALIRYEEPSEMNEDPAGYAIHPGLLDSCLQSTVAFGVKDAPIDAEAAGLAVPFAAGKVALYCRPAPSRPLWGHVRALQWVEHPVAGIQVESADLTMFGDDGQTVVEVDGFRVRRAPRAVLEQSLRSEPSALYHLDWTTQPPRSAVDTRPMRAYRVAVLGTDDDLVRTISRRLELLGHAVVQGGDTRQEIRDIDLILDTRCVAGAAEPNPSEVVTQTAMLVESLKVAPRHVPYAVLTEGTGHGGQDRTAPLRESVWGLLAALEAEQHDRRLLRIRLDDGWTGQILVDSLLRSLDEGVSETRLVVNAKGVQVSRLRPVADRTMAPSTAGQRRAALITGGLGALGLSSATILAKHGIAAITLLARSAPDAAATGIIDDLGSAGVRVRIVLGDITDPQTCRQAVAEAEKDAPLGVVLHLAGTTDDQAFENLTGQSLAHVFDAKAVGAMNLVAALKGRELASLLLFSSASSVLGAAGQANYAAANGFLDGLAQSLRSAGVRATSVNWGPWVPQVKTGLAASNSVARVMRKRGIRPLTDNDAEELLRAALASERPNLLAIAVDRHRYADSFAGHPGANLFDPATPAASPTSAVVGVKWPPGWLRRVIDGLEPAQRRDRLVLALREMAGVILGDPNAVDDARGFTEMGFDSIMVIDLRTQLSHALTHELPATLALDHPTITQATAYLLARLFPEDDAQADEPPDSTTAYGDDADAELSFEELIQAVQADLATSE